MSNIEDKIIKAAAKTFVNGGYFHATTRKIADDAGINEITLFRKFKSKENLLRAVMKREEENVSQLMNRMLFEECDPDVKKCLRNLTIEMCNMPDEELGLFVTLYDARLIVPQIKKHIYKILQMMVSLVSKYLNEQIKRGNVNNIDPDVAAGIFIGYQTNNILLTGYAPNELLIDNSEKRIDDFIDFFMRGISKHK
jgi:AcrR family transcriptional regulator